MSSSVLCEFKIRGTASKSYEVGQLILFLFFLFFLLFFFFIDRLQDAYKLHYIETYI